MLSSEQIRQQFIDFFVEKHGHTFVPSSPVVPHGDPTLLFANAGMNQFKPYFLGTEEPPYPRAANTQKCIRAGGKHNDLEDVGKDTYHHTFFEMLGNWSFGDYFKKEAIDWAWELLVDTWGLDPARLHATYFEGDASEGLEPDNEARELWLKYLPAERIHPGNKKDNFWEMGDTGPCGPCSEIHYDATDDLSGGSKVNQDNPLVIEIWNLVFIQFNRGTDGKLTPLPAKHVDTGMGFERITRVIQGKTSNYDTDVFTPIFEAISKVTDTRPYKGIIDDSDEGKIDTAYRVIADHIRTLTFALSDGAHCGNEGRNYVLRRILRRAVHFGRNTLGVEKPFFYRLVPAVVDHMGGFFPELKRNPQAVVDELKEEEEAFRRTLDRGTELLDDHMTVAGTRFMAEIAGNVRIEEWARAELRRVSGEQPSYHSWNAAGFDWRTCPGDLKPQIPAQDAFDLFATYGFPIDLTRLMAEERGMTVDEAGFDKLYKQHQEVSRGKAGGTDVAAIMTEIVQKESLKATEFIGFDHVEWTGNVDVRFFRLDSLAGLVTSKTPFYAEAGGQVGDTGAITCGDATLHVSDTQRIGDVIFHLGKLEGAPPEARQSQVTFKVDKARRTKIMSNHTSTHVMNHKLREVLGDHVQQKGSLVDDEKTRFDFSHAAAVSTDEIAKIEEMVNHDIGADLPVYYDYAPQAEALKIEGLRAVFGEKYPPRVRIVSIGVPVEDLLADPKRDDWRKYSVEFCGGTHLPKTGDAEGFVIVSEEAVAKGVRRLTGITGDAAHQAQATADRLLSRIEALKGANPGELDDQISKLTGQVNESVLPLVAKTKLRDEIAALQQVVKEHRKQQSKEAAGDIVEEARRIADEADGEVIVAAIDGADGNTLRTAMDVIKKKKPDAALLLGSVAGDKIAFVAAVPKPLIERGLKAGDWVREVAKVAGGGGGGRPDMAQAGGKDPSKLNDALETARTFAAEKL